MRRFHWMALVALSTLFGSIAIAQQRPATRGAAPAAPAAPAQAAPATPAAVGYATPASIQELMLSIVDPTGDALWDSVSVSITSAGSKETRPRTDAEWLAVRDKALLLAESGNLLKVPGRRVGPIAPIRGLKPETPGPDDLSPAQVEILLKQNRAPFNAFAQKLTDAALVAVKAVDARNVDGMYEAGDLIDQACENCHLNYWYPGPKSPIRNLLKK